MRTPTPAGMICCKKEVNGDCQRPGPLLGEPHRLRTRRRPPNGRNPSTPSSRRKGHQRGREIMLSLLKRSKDLHLGVPMVPTTDYINTIAPENEPEFPGDEELERRYRAWIRWNAAITVHRAQRPGIARRRPHLDLRVVRRPLRGRPQLVLPRPGPPRRRRPDLLPGPRLPRHVRPRLPRGPAQRGPARRLPPGEVARARTASRRYPHPRLMPEFWQFPTVSMGLGPINAIYQAQSNRYLTNRGIKDASDQQVWAFLGDGEMDEVESRGALQWAANEDLDNLTFVINCNLQRLDGPVRGNGKIIQELESFFRGAGWNVIKVVWGREWDDLLARDTDGALRQPHERHARRRLPDLQGRVGRLRARELLRPRPRARSSSSRTYTDDQIWNLKRGGHDYRKVYAAFKAATEHKGQPTVILAKTVKGYGLGPSFEGRNATHQMKKLTLDNLKTVPRRDAHPDHATRSSRRTRTSRRSTTRATSDEAIQYLQERRRALGGYLPERRSKYTRSRCPTTRRTTIVEEGLRQAGDRHHHGVRAAAEGPAAGARTSATASCRSSRMRRAPSAWTPTSRRRRSTTRTASTTPRSTASCCWPTRRARRARSCTSASTRPARSRRSPPSARRTRRRASRSSRSTSSTRCSGSSAPATRCGRPATRWRAASSSARPPAAPR